MTLAGAAEETLTGKQLPIEHQFGTGFRLRSDLRMACIGSRVVLLDLAASRYFLLEGLAAGRFRSFVDGTADASSLRWLENRHFIEPGEAFPSEALPPTPTRSVFDAPLPPVRPWLVAEAVAAQIAASRRIRRESLASLLRPHGSGRDDPGACGPIAAACRVAARYRSAADQCLPNAIAMRAMLNRRGVKAEIVIGVMLPFAAHCWLQSGDMILSDPFGNIQNFEPLVAA